MIINIKFFRSDEMKVLEIINNTIMASKLFEDNKEIKIIHDNKEYKLRLTSQNKLILTK